METKVILVENVYLTESGKVENDGLELKFESLNECFNYLEKKGHPIAHNNFRPVKPVQTVRKDEKNIIVYEPRDTPNGAAKRLVNLAEAGASCYYIEQQRSCSENLPYEAFLKAYADWERAKIARKFFHPGNSLTLTFILIAIGLGLGAACPPALVFVALGVAAFSAISAIVYAGDWLRRDWSVYKTTRQAEIDKGGFAGITPTFGHYLSQYPLRLLAWAKAHKLQAILMGIGAVIFLGALAVVAGHFIAIAVTGADFAFMTMGVSGGALGLTSSFFAAGFGAISGLASSVAVTLTSAFTAMALVLGPTNILDSVRRFASWFYKRFFGEESLSNEPDAPPAVIQKMKMPEGDRKLLGGGDAKLNTSVPTKPKEKQPDNPKKKTTSALLYRDTSIDIESDSEESDVEKNPNASSNTRPDDETSGDEKLTRMNVVVDLFGENDKEEEKGHKKSREGLSLLSPFNIEEELKNFDEEIPLGAALSSEFFMEPLSKGSKPNLRINKNRLSEDEADDNWPKFDQFDVNPTKDSKQGIGDAEESIFSSWSTAHIAPANRLQNSVPIESHPVWPNVSTYEGFDSDSSPTVTNNNFDLAELNPNLNI